MPPRIRITLTPGQRFGRLVVLEEIRLPLTRKDQREGRRQGVRGARLACDCGGEIEVSASRLTSGNTTSCGCARIDAVRVRNLVHGLARHPLYHTWLGMKHRCESPRSPNFNNYGGRGIRVCAQWATFPGFLRDIDALLGPRPDGYSLDRINNDGDYEPGNVRWATAQEQQRNRRPTV